MKPTHYLFREAGQTSKEVPAGNESEVAAMFEQAKKEGYTLAVSYFRTSKGRWRIVQRYTRPIGGPWETRQAFYDLNKGPHVGDPIYTHEAPTKEEQERFFLTTVRRCPDRDTDSGSYIIITETGGKRFAEQRHGQWIDQGPWIHPHSRLPSRS